MKIYFNPINIFSQSRTRRLSVPAVSFHNSGIKVNHVDYSTGEVKTITVNQNPLDKAVLYKKVYNSLTGKYDKKPFCVDVASCEEKNLTRYVLLDPKSHKELAYCEIAQVKKLPHDVVVGSLLTKDFPEYGLVGDKVTILGLKNNYHDSLSGVGEVCDRIAIEYCLKNKIKPNIISYADCDSHAAHYKRGRKFIDVRKTPFFLDPQKFYQRYGTYDPNVVIKKLVDSAPEGQRVCTGNLFGVFMYMPQDVVQNYMKVINQQPILH